MMDDERIITISPLLTHALPLYLAPPRLDPPHTHTHGEVRFHPLRENERRERGKGEKLPSSVLSSSYPSSLLFIGAGRLREDTPSTLGMCPGANQEPTHGRLGSVEAKAVRPTSGVG
jgi:hypothetical protein